MRAIAMAGLLIGIVACASERDAATKSPDSPAWVVRPESFGPLPLGVPLAQTAAVLGGSLAPRFAASDNCAQLAPDALPPGASLMVLRDSTGAPLMLERVDVDTTGILTAEGAGVGDTEARVLELYAGRVEVMPHKYTGPEGHYLVATSPRDTMFAIVFETDGKVVRNFRAGRRPAVEFVEGCA
jgi:hypothetical protein